METVYDDIPQDIKEKFIIELKNSNYELAEQKPIGNGSFGYVYKTKSKSGVDAAHKVIIIRKDIPEKERLALIKSINEEVTISG